MCGISGIIGLETELARPALEAMNAAIAHRGPDDSGVVVESGVALGQRRLSIIDLTAAGHQPMVSADGNLVLVFNGEIYNYRELKQQLGSYTFRTNTDTEVILAAYERWGKDCVQHFNGMFAFALWDKVKKEILLFRDRLGVKPLYYYRQNGVLLFASELRALLASGFVPRKLNKAALSDYLRYQTVHAPDTMVMDVQLLLPGHGITIKGGVAEEFRYWSAEENVSREAEGKSYDEVKQDVHDLLMQAVERRLVADVPFGAFLSGGIDSSAVVGLMSRVATKKVRTFAVTFAEEEFSEAKYAATIAQKFNTEHTEIRLTPQDFLETVPDALKAMDHPSGDGPNTYVVSKVTKEAGITMALSGLGGDELFGGYDVFKRLHKLNQFSWVAALPIAARRIVGLSLVRLRPSVASAKINQLLSLASWDMSHTYPITRQVYPDKLLQQLLGEQELLPNKVQELIARQIRKQENQQLLPVHSQVSSAEFSTYMQNTLLRDTDQMSMAHALEVRVPFLDYKLVEYVLGVPDNYKYPSTPKKLLTESLDELLPLDIINRPKMGFTLPWKEWLRNELFTFCNEKIKNLADRNLFVKHEILALWNAFLQQQPHVTWSRVWYLIVLENWLEEQGVE